MDYVLVAAGLAVAVVIWLLVRPRAGGGGQGGDGGRAGGQGAGTSARAMPVPRPQAMAGGKAVAGVRAGPQLISQEPVRLSPPEQLPEMPPSFDGSVSDGLIEPTELAGQVENEYESGGMGADLVEGSGLVATESLAGSESMNFFVVDEAPAEKAGVRPPPLSNIARAAAQAGAGGGAGLEGSLPSLSDAFGLADDDQEDADLSSLPIVNLDRRPAADRD